MEVELDENALRLELQELRQQREQVDERLRNFNTRGRGRGPGGFAGRGFPARSDSGTRDGPYTPREGPYTPRGAFNPGNGAGARNGAFSPRQNDFNSRTGPFASGREARSNGLLGGREAPSNGSLRLRSEVSAAPSNVAVKKRLASAVVVKGQPRAVQAQEQPPQQPLEAEPQPARFNTEFEVPGTAKRPAPTAEDDNPAAKKRNRRMFGALLGTLAKFKQEDEQFNQSTAAQRRQESLQRAEQKKREEARAMRQQYQQELAAERQAEINRKRELTALTEVKRLQIVAALRLKHRAKLANFIRTTTGPALFWLPAAHNDATQRLLEQQQEALQQWKAEELGRLERERERIMAGVRAAAARSEPQTAEEAAQEAEEAQPASEDQQPAGGAADEDRQDGGQGEDAAEHTKAVAVDHGAPSGQAEEEDEERYADGANGGEASANPADDAAEKRIGELAEDGELDTDAYRAHDEAQADDTILDDDDGQGIEDILQSDP